jgi:hypothetical protein
MGLSAGVLGGYPLLAGPQGFPSLMEDDNNRTLPHFFCVESLLSVRLIDHRRIYGR